MQVILKFFSLFFSLILWYDSMGDELLRMEKIHKRKCKLKNLVEFSTYEGILFYFFLKNNLLIYS